MKKIEGPMITLRYPEELVKELDRIAKANGETRAETMRKLLAFGVDVYGDFESFGVAQLANVLKRAKSTITSKLAPSLF